MNPKMGVSHLNGCDHTNILDTPQMRTPIGQRSSGAAANLSVCHIRAHIEENEPS